MANETHATAAVIDYVTKTTLDTFPSEAVSLARQCIVDGVGVILAGSAARGTGIVRDYVRTGKEAGQATVLGAETFSCRTASAALINGTAGHALDFDDTASSGCSRIRRFRRSRRVWPSASTWACQAASSWRRT
jgi:2-methylcitrate dehydratase PrpD